MPDDLDVIRRAKAGDHAAQTALLKQHAGAIYRMAFRYVKTSPWADVEDLAQAGRLGFLRAVELFDEARGVKLMTYCSWHVRSYVEREAERAGVIRVPTPARRTMHLQEDKNRALSCLSIDNWPKGEHYLAIDLPWPERKNEVWDEADRAAIRQALGVLENRERTIIEARFFEGLTLKETGRRLGITRERVRQIQVDAIKKLRRSLQQQGFVCAG